MLRTGNEESRILKIQVRSMSGIITVHHVPKSRYYSLVHVSFMPVDL